MTVTLRKAIREQTNVLLALAGPSGCGKTMSALRIARGLAGPDGRIALLDTEAGRALHYADQFDFDHGDLKPPFTPEMHADALLGVERDGYRVIVVDSMSHEYEGEGGLQDIHDDIHQKMGGTDATNAGAWREPKRRHKRLIQRLLQCRAHLIFCLRAEEKIKFVKVDGKTRILDAGWLPICEKRFMYEMSASFMLSDARPGIGVAIKLPEYLKPCFPADALLDEQAGIRLAAWATGGAPVTERQRLMAAIRSEGGHLVESLRKQLWAKHCGTATAETADEASLNDLLTALRAVAA